MSETAPCIWLVGLMYHFCVVWYPKVAHVVRADLDRVAQLRPGDRVRFARVTRDDAAAAARGRAAAVRFWLTRLRTADRAPAVSSW